MFKVQRAVPLAVFVAILIALGAGLMNDPHKMPSQLIDKPVPAFKLPSLIDGQDGLSNADFGGGIKLLNVFASWCPGCRVEHPTLLRLQQANAIPLLGINWKDKPDAGLKWLNANKSPYLKVGEDMNGRFGIELGVTGVPETFVIDRTGRVRYRHAGPLTDEVWTETFVPLLASLREER